MSKKNPKLNNLNNLKLLDPKQDDLQIPNICKFVRLVFQATQKQMAEKLSVNLSTYRDWEYGTYVPKSWQAINLGLLYLHAKEQIAKQETLNEQISDDSRQAA